MKDRVIEETVYDVQDVIDVGYTLEPLRCRFCGSHEVTFYQYIGDAFCETCGSWQLEGSNSKTCE